MQNSDISVIILWSFNLSLVISISTNDRRRAGCRILAKDKRQFSTGGERVKPCLDKLDIFRLAGPDGIHRGLLTEVAEATSEALAIISENPWRMRGRDPGGLAMHIV